VAIVLVAVPFYGELLSSLRSVQLFRLLRPLRAGVVIGRALLRHTPASRRWQGAPASSTALFVFGRTGLQWSPVMFG
jgi:hypothetical protein